MADLWLLTSIVFIPAVTAIVLVALPSKATEAIRLVTFVATLAVLALVVGGLLLGQFDTSDGQMQKVFTVPWISSFEIFYAMGLDGISLPLVLLTAVISVLAMGASWGITKHVKGYCILFLLLESGMMGVFCAIDFFLFYIFWEVMLLPMYFLIGVWGGPRKEYAAIKFFLYTLVGGVLMLIALLMIYFNSDLRELQKSIGGQSQAWQNLHIHESVEKSLETGTEPIHTFNMLALASMAQHTNVFDGLVLGQSIQWWAFLLFLIGFIIKLPSVPVHTWLPDAHVEAPTPISMILAGVLLKMGGYGVIRICYPICPQGGYELAWLVCGLGVVSMVYGAFAAMAQKDFKRLVAYSSVSHMGYVLLGMGVWSSTAGYVYDWSYWDMGIKGAMFQMIGHGISSAGMFFVVGVIYDRVHHRNLNEFGGLFGKMPIYTALSIGIFFAGLGLPGLCGFIGEVFVVLSVWPYSKVLAVISAAVVILTAGYILWTVQRVYLGPEYKGKHGENLTPITFREGLIGGVLFVSAIVLGVFPWQTMLRYMDSTIDRQVQDLAAWTEKYEPANQQIQQYKTDQLRDAIRQKERELDDMRDELINRETRVTLNPSPEPTALAAGRAAPSKFVRGPKLTHPTLARSAENRSPPDKSEGSPQFVVDNRTKALPESESQLP